MDEAARLAIKDLQADALLIRAGLATLTSLLVASGKLDGASIGTLDRSISSTIEMAEFRDEERKQAERELHAGFIRRLKELLPSELQR